MKKDTIVVVTGVKEQKSYSHNAFPINLITKIIGTEIMDVNNHFRYNGYWVKYITTRKAT